MKRILAALLTLTLTVAFLAACNGGKDPAPTETTPNAQTQPSGSDICRNTADDKKSAYRDFGFGR